MTEQDPVPIGSTFISGAPKVSIGRIVHYNDYPFPNAAGPDVPDPDCWNAAMIVCVHGDETVDLIAWDQFGHQSFLRMIELGTGRHQWRWPPQV